jgi:two-component system sensor histidine kinase/response regulator
MASGKLLVVDDEESVAVTMGAILEMDGYDVAISMSGADALKRIHETSFDLVLTDLRLDDVDGLTIINEICRVQPDAVTIILTGYASMESAINALREGAYDYLVKPCDVDELRAVVARGIERRQLGLQLKDRLGELETANQTIRELNRDLQQRIEAATAQLQERMQELASALEQLQEIDRLKSRFLSMASHELKTPLTSISGLAQVLLRRMRRRLEVGRPSEEDWHEEQSGHVGRLELLNSQTARLGRLVDELLDVSRIESGKLEFRLQPVDMVQLVHEVAGRMQLSTSTHAIEVELNGTAQNPVNADRDHLEQVLDNLVSNAIKFSPDGGAILLRLRDEGDSVTVSIQDSGVGIPGDQLDAVFGLFYQAEDPVSRRTGGMGLGLYISKEIISRHGGRIWADSQPGAGSTFNFSLPRKSMVTTARPGPGRARGDHPGR